MPAGVEPSDLLYVSYANAPGKWGSPWGRAVLAVDAVMWCGPVRGGSHVSSASVGRCAAGQACAALLPSPSHASLLREMCCQPLHGRACSTACGPRATCQEHPPPSLPPALLQEVCCPTPSCCTARARAWCWPSGAQVGVGAGQGAGAHALGALNKAAGRLAHGAANPCYPCSPAIRPPARGVLLLARRAC